MAAHSGGVVISVDSENHYTKVGWYGMNLHRRTTHIRADDGEQLAALLEKPAYAWPTLIVFVTVCVSFAVNSVYAFRRFDELSGGELLVSASINMICAYMSYTVLHEAAHGLVTRHRHLNNWIGRVSLSFISIVPFFFTYRHFHIMHHQHVNSGQDDPDMFCTRGARHLLPVRWALMDFAYLLSFFKRRLFARRPNFVKREFCFAIVFGAGVLAVVTSTGQVWEFIVIYLLPTRVALMLLAFSFDFLPHYPHDVQFTDNPYHATSNRIGFEWLLTPLLLGQNYHLAHHIYPTSSFYRYRRIWHSRQTFHDAQDPRYVRAFRLTPNADPPAALSGRLDKVNR